MRYKTFAKRTKAFIEKAAEVVRKSGYPDAKFTWSDLGDYYHIHGVNSSGAGFGRYLVDKHKRAENRRKRKKTKRDDIKKVSPKRRIK